MSCIQSTSVCWASTRNERAFLPLVQSSWKSSSTPKLRRVRSLPRFVHRAPNYRCVPVCLFGGKGNSESKDEAFSWDSLKKAMESMKKEPSLQDRLREQMRERNFDEDGGSKNPPGGGSGGDGSDGPEDEGFLGILDETLQVILATIGFIFVYIYLIHGEELSRLAKDYIKYLFGAKTSVRLRRAMYKWKKFYDSIVQKEEYREDWLERAIVATPTWWHKPKKLVQAMKSGQLVPSQLPPSP